MPTSILVRRLSYLELSARTSATNHSNQPFQDVSNALSAICPNKNDFRERLIQALSKNVFIWADIALNALETFCLSLVGYISVLIYLLTYLLTYYAEGGRHRVCTTKGYWE